MNKKRRLEEMEKHNLYNIVTNPKAEQTKKATQWAVSVCAGCLKQFKSILIQQFSSTKSKLNLHIGKQKRFGLACLNPSHNSSRKPLLPSCCQLKPASLMSPSIDLHHLVLGPPLFLYGFHLKACLVVFGLHGA